MSSVKVVNESNGINKSVEIGGCLVKARHYLRADEAMTVLEITEPAEIFEYEDSSTYIPAQTVTVVLKSADDIAELLEVISNK